MEENLKTMQDQLNYINHFPVTQKYISLFPKKDDEKSKQRREEAMQKVLKLASVKQGIRERDLQEEIKEQPWNNKNKKNNTSGDKEDGKDKEDVEGLDPFFVEAGAGEDEAKPIVQAAGEKREVMRDGRVPKFQRNLAKMQERAIVAQTKREGWEQKKEDEKKEKERVKRQFKPMKFNAASFGTGIAQSKAKGAAPAEASKANIKF